MSLLGAIFKFDQRTEKAQRVTVIIPGDDIGRRIRFEAHFDPGKDVAPWAQNTDGSRDYDHVEIMGCRVHIDYNEETGASSYTFFDFRDGRVPDKVNLAIDLERE